MSAFLALGVLALYFLLLFAIAQIVAKDDSNQTFFEGKRSSPWYLVAFGMIGASLSGVTFLSVPGAVGSGQFSYFQMVLGYFPGYMFIAFVLMPIYYRLKLTSIYEYLGQRFDRSAHLTGSGFFLLSRIVGASFRLYLVAGVLQIFIFEQLGISFMATVAITIILIWIYTFKGGIKSIVWTDTLQTFSMITAVIIALLIILKQLALSPAELIGEVKNSSYAQTFFFKETWSNSLSFWKQFLAGASIAIVMTGLDQDMMQKNLTCKNIGEAQKNMVSFSLILIPINLLFLFLGGALYIYSNKMGLAIPNRPDELFTLIARDHLGVIGGIVFFIGVIAAAYSSADSALTSLTTAFCVDFLGFNKKVEISEYELKNTRRKVHIGFSVTLFLCILLFRLIGDESVINSIFRFAGYTYGPLLGLFFFGLFTKRSLRHFAAVYVCISAPFVSHFLKIAIENNTSYVMGFEFLILNGLVTFLGLLFNSTDKKYMTKFEPHKL